MLVVGGYGSGVVAIPAAVVVVVVVVVVIVLECFSWQTAFTRMITHVASYRYWSDFLLHYTRRTLLAMA